MRSRKPRHGTAAGWQWTGVCNVNCVIYRVKRRLQTNYLNVVPYLTVFELHTVTHTYYSYDNNEPIDRGWEIPQRNVYLRSYTCTTYIHTIIKADIILRQSKSEVIYPWRKCNLSFTNKFHPSLSNWLTLIFEGLRYTTKKKYGTNFKHCRTGSHRCLLKNGMSTWWEKKIR